MATQNFDTLGNVTVGSIRAIAIGGPKSGQVHAVSEQVTGTGCAGGAVEVLDASSLAINEQNCVEVDPYAIAVITTTDVVYVANYLDNTVSVIQTR